ncbi:MAG TPA: hypothetical protein VHZ74_02890 [Bryobacteraceae bacterium]|jgi:4'-phosphopantetheinyl transferase|nr:hypothetical protein [Bryobacteraceae bacterium]
MPHPVDLWTVSLVSSEPSVLSAEETARANRFKFEKDRLRWACARSSLRRVLSGYAGIDPERLGFTYGQHGKPALLAEAGIQFNLSHAGDWALIAVSRAIAVGVDIERIREKIDMGPLLKRLGESDAPGTPQELYQRWTRREARSKAAGGALFDSPAEAIRAVDVNSPDGYAASLALVGCEPLVRYRGGNL